MRRTLLLLPLVLLSGCPDEPEPPATDDDDAAPIPGNSSPTAPFISITPAAPEIEDDLTCVIDQESVDPDGDEVTYAFEWWQDDTMSGVTSATLPASETGGEEWWTCRVTASDGALRSGPVEATVEVGHINQPPTAPDVAIVPAEPSVRQNLNCTGSGSTDLEGAEITYSYAWERDGAATGETGETVDHDETAEGEEWTCIVTASDGELESTGEASVTIGPACISLSFGGDGYVAIPDAPELRLFETDFTVEAWVRRTGTGGNQHAIAYKRGTAFQDGWGLFIDNDGAPGNFAWVQSRGSDPGLAATSTELPGAWLHVAYTYAWDSGAGEGTGTLWVDGLPSGSDILPSPSGSSTAPLNLGRDGGFDTHYLSGQLDDVHISSVVRYDGIFAPSASALPDADTIGFWRFEEGEGLVAHDSGPNGFDGTVEEAAWTLATSACTAGR